MGNNALKLDGLMKLPGKKKLELIGLFIVIVTLALVLLPTNKQGSTNNTASTDVFDIAREHEQLVAILSNIKGVGKAEVMITYEMGSEKVPAYDSDATTSLSQNTQNQASSQRPATDSGGTVVVAQKRPKVLGVVVVAKGASDYNVKIMLSQAVQTALGINANQVEVFEMKP